VGFSGVESRHIFFIEPSPPSLGYHNFSILSANACSGRTPRAIYTSPKVKMSNFFRMRFYTVRLLYIATLLHLLEFFHSLFLQSHYDVNERTVMMPFTL